MEMVMSNGFAELSAYEMNEVEGGLIMTGPMLGPVTVSLLVRLIGKYL